MKYKPLSKGKTVGVLAAIVTAAAIAILANCGGKGGGRLGAQGENEVVEVRIGGDLLFSGPTSAKVAALHRSRFQLLASSDGESSAGSGSTAGGGGATGSYTVTFPGTVYGTPRIGTKRSTGSPTLTITYYGVTVGSSSARTAPGFSYIPATSTSTGGNDTNCDANAALAAYLAAIQSLSPGTLSQLGDLAELKAKVASSSGQEACTLASALSCMKNAIQSATAKTESTQMLSSRIQTCLSDSGSSGPGGTSTTGTSGSGTTSAASGSCSYPLSHTCLEFTDAASYASVKPTCTNACTCTDSAGCSRAGALGKCETPAYGWTTIYDGGYPGGAANAQSNCTSYRGTWTPQ